MKQQQTTSADFGQWAREIDEARKSRRGRQNGVVTVTELDPEVLESVRELAGGDWGRVEWRSPTEAVVHNSRDWPKDKIKALPPAKKPRRAKTKKVPPCPECGQDGFKAMKGLGSHRRKSHGVVGTSKEARRQRAKATA